MTIKDSASQAGAFASEKLHDATSQVRDAAEAARSVAGDALGSAREKVASAYQAARERSGSASEKAVQTIDASPFAALLGGIALGAVLGALLPRSEREAEALGPIGQRLTEAAQAAFAAAKEAATQTLDELGVNSETARGQVDKLLDTAAQAASSAGSAALGAVRQGSSGVQRG